MKYRVVHETQYSYSEQASISQNELFLQPRSTAAQNVISSQLVINPVPQYLRQRTDYFDNQAHVFMVQHPHSELSITVTSDVETLATPNLQLNNSQPWETAVQAFKTHNDEDLLNAFQFVFSSPMTAITPGIREYALVSFPPNMPVLSGAINLTERIYKEFKYEKDATSVDTPVEQVLASKKGVCQDFAHFAISCLRSIGLSARYVSGYLETLPPPGQQKLVGADASHAWVSLFVPGFGWVDLDPTNNMIPGERHITVAWGRDYSDVTPVKGVVMGGGMHTLNVTVDVSSLTV